MACSVCHLECHLPRAGDATASLAEVARAEEDERALASALDRDFTAAAESKKAALLRLAAADEHEKVPGKPPGDSGNDTLGLKQMTVCSRFVLVRASASSFNDVHSYAGL